jgi:hypothetical protein
MLGCLAAGAVADKKASAHGIKILKLCGMYRLRDMHEVLHNSKSTLAEGMMRRIFISSLVLLAGIGAGMQMAQAGGQGYPGGAQIPGGRGGAGQPGMSQPGADTTTTPSPEKPDAAARKAFNAGVKSLNRAREFEEVAAKATNPDKRAGAMEKVGDAYSRALDQFTEALSNKGDMVDAWNYAGYVGHRAAPGAMRAADIDAFDKWLQERDGIAKQTASAAAATAQ